ncbi:Cof-type HAD-IIB family hydrolase [Thermoflavimicrobium daqui]|uniref:Cof-type HAD-IIB family hydrolase n=1 Tax=Thermoflavimicrobium daqui TaxID=2137476 RepID=A0A364K7K5_9BACL|nr:Cof-type HAD-IIB family hydrolase [Thermoflavimicrobium daqui]RAL26281.1 Cof-type HAD-IIB family hydrolase [Thermoflavimicrobium daqui]
MKLVAIDMDGTLLSKERVISKENADAIKKAQSLGNIISICTGRSVEDAQELLDAANLQCPIIAANGAVIFYNHQIIKRTPLGQHDAENIIQYLEEHAIYYHLYTHQGVYAPEYGKQSLQLELDITKSANPEMDMTEFNMWTQFIFEKASYIPVKSCQPLFAESILVDKILAFSYQQEKLARLHQILAENPHLAITASATHNIEINHIDAQKGNGLKSLANHLQIPLKDTVAIGDNLNDLSMMKIAGLSIAMGNSVDQVKQICHHETLSNDENGVAYALDKYVSA